MLVDLEQITLTVFHDHEPDCSISASRVAAVQIARTGGQSYEGNKSLYWDTRLTAARVSMIKSLLQQKKAAWYHAIVEA